MAEFTAAVAFVIASEGGFVHSPNDSGGATNFGISLRFLRDIPLERLRRYGFFSNELSVSDIANLTIDQARLIYRGEFWEMEPFESISRQSIANYVFDCCVLHGTYQGIMIFQRALCAAYQNKDEVKSDGILGSQTLIAEAHTDEKILLSCLIACRDGFVRLCAAFRPEDREFFDGWINRCYKT